MATIHLTDQFGLDIKLDPDPASVFVKYVKGLTEANASVKDGNDIRGGKVLKPQQVLSGPA